MINRKLERLAVGVLDGRASRRDFLQHAAHTGISASAAYAFLQTVGGARPARAASNVSGEITMIKGPHAAKEAEFEAMIIDDFNRDVAPDVTVNFTTYDWGNMNTELTTAFAGGSPPDVLYLVDLVYPFFAERGLLHDMTAMVDDPDWASERAAIEPFAWGLASQGGGIWGVPVLGAVYNIFVNLDLLDAAGVTDTWQRSYGDMLAAAQATTSDDVYGFSMRNRVSDYAFWDWYPYMHNAAADILNGDWSGCGLDNPDAVAAMDFLIEIHKAGVTPAVGSFDWQGQTDLFKAGKIAIHHNETPLIPVLDANPPGFRWGVAAAPPGPSGRTVMGNFGILCIAEASENKEAAWEFIKHWASGPQVGRFADQVNLQVVRSDIVGDLFQGNAAMQKVQNEFVPAVQGVQPHPKILQMIQTLWPAAENAYLGNSSGEQAIAEMCQAVDSVLEFIVATGAAAENPTPPRPRLPAAEHRRLSRRYRRHRSLTAYGFLAPNLVFFTLFMLLPVLWLAWLTFHTGGVLEPVSFVGLHNWERVFGNALVLKTIGNTLLYCLMAIPAVFILAMILALCLKNIRHGTVTIRAILYLPTLQPVLTAALMWTFVVHPDFGVLNLIARAVSGEQINFLGSTSLALPTIAMVEVWRGLGFWTLLFLAGLLAMPQDLFYAAALDGAGALRRFFDLTLPLLRPTFYFAVVFATIVNLQLFDSVFALTDGGPVNSTATIAWYVYRSLFAFGNTGFGATLSFVLVLVVLILTGAQLLLFREKRGR